ncbi:MAG TPA: hypothetical protein IAB65_00435 [Candidatus Onthocola stercorigallinarum]|nr:hypothetical protein [Candidatus Onthocola stercorigallinarum]
MNSYTFNKFIDTLFFYLDKLEKEYSSEDVIKEFKKILKKAYFTEGAIIRDISEEDEKRMIRNTEKEIAFREGKTEVIINVIKNALEKNLPIETIAVAVGLSVDEVKKIIKENNLDKTGE